MEQELKYQIIDPVSAKRYHKRGYWQQHALDLKAVKELIMHAQYFDTAERQLAAVGSSLRIRREGSDVFLTLKYTAQADADITQNKTDALFVRQEWEWPLSYQADQAYEEEAWHLLHSKLSELPLVLQSIIIDAKWLKLYEARFSRFKADLISDTVHLELAIDDGFLEGTFGSEAVHELEVELKSGELASLLNMHEALLKEKDLKVQGLSKSARLSRLSTADFLIVGAGASGLMAAVTYKQEYPEGRLVLLEAQAKAAMKLTAAGNGRGNISNLGLSSANYHQTAQAVSSEVIEKQLETCSPEELCQTFYGLGLLTRVENQRIYPFTYQAKTVSDLLVEEVSSRPGTTMLYGMKAVAVSNISQASTGTLYRIEIEDGRLLYCRQLLLTCGGQAVPDSGSDGHAYEILQHLDHSISPLYPGLVHLDGKDLPKHFIGERLHAKLTIYVDNIPVGNDFGDLLLTDYGLSGIPVLNLSHLAARAIYENREVHAIIDLASELVLGELEAFIERRIYSYPNMLAKQFALGFLSDKLSSAIANLAGIPDELPLNELKAEEIAQLIKLCRELKISITGTKGFDYAQVTCGGAVCDEFDPLTLESLRHEGLYASGEILDVFGDWGGYNLHFAFVSGMNAGRAVGSKQAKTMQRNAH